MCSVVVVVCSCTVAIYRRSAVVQSYFMNNRQDDFVVFAVFRELIVHANCSICVPTGSVELITVI